MNKIGWIGLGKCGLPIAEKIGETETVLAYDLVTKDTVNVEFVQDVARLNETDTTFILVQTPNRDDLDGSLPVDIDNLTDYDYTALEAALASLLYIGYGGVIVVSSTVSPGTMRRLAAKYSSLRLVYMPVMIHIGTVAADYVSAPQYVIGSNSQELAFHVEKVVRRFVKTNTFAHLTFDEVELYKMMNNIYSSIKILFANNISEMIEYGNLPASSWNVMNALLNDTKNFASLKYMSPGSGNGGPCHPRDGVVLSWLEGEYGLKSHLMTAVVQTREQQAAALAEKLVSYGLPVVILGKSFRAGVDLTVGSYSVLVGNICEKLGAQVFYDTQMESPAVYCITHNDPTVIAGYCITDDSHVVDLWNLGVQAKNVKVWGDNRFAT